MLIALRLLRFLIFINQISFLLDEERLSIETIINSDKSDLISTSYLAASAPASVIIAWL